MATATENQTTPQTEHKIKLTSAEIANIWSNYMSDSAAICTLGSFLSHVEDKEIKSTLEFAEQLSQTHIQKIEAFFREEQYPIPDGFSVKTDLIKASPRLFTDDFFLFYIQNVGKIGLEFYTNSLSNCA